MPHPCALPPPSSRHELARWRTYRGSVFRCSYLTITERKIGVEVGGGGRSRGQTATDRDRHTEEETDRETNRCGGGGGDWLVVQSLILKDKNLRQEPSFTICHSYVLAGEKKKFKNKNKKKKEKNKNTYLCKA